MPGPTAATSASAPSSFAAHGHRRPPQGAPEPRRPGAPGPRAPQAPPAAAESQEAASDVVRWAAFSCVLVPVVLVGYGMSLAGAAGAALGLAAVTGVCRVLLQQSERGAARLLAEQEARNSTTRGRHGRGGSGGAPECRSKRA